MIDKPDIVATIKAEGFQPIRRGSRLFILCPFHPDKNPSCLINTERQIFHCFACSAHGDVIDFIMELKGFSFPEACDYLGIRLSRKRKVNPKSKPKTPQKELEEEFEQLIKIRTEVEFRAAFSQWLENRLAFLNEIIAALEDTLETIPETSSIFDVLYSGLQKWQAEKEFLTNGSLEEKLKFADKCPKWRLVSGWLTAKYKRGIQK